MKYENGTAQNNAFWEIIIKHAFAQTPVKVNTRKIFSESTAFIATMSKDGEIQLAANHFAANTIALGRIEPDSLVVTIKGDEKESERLTKNRDKLPQQIMYGEFRLSRSNIGEVKVLASYKTQSQTTPEEYKICLSRESYAKLAEIALRKLADRKTGAKLLHCPSPEAYIAELNQKCSYARNLIADIVKHSNIEGSRVTAIMQEACSGPARSDGSGQFYEYAGALKEALGARADSHVAALRTSEAKQRGK